VEVTIPQLTIELEEDGTVLLEQEWCGETDRIQLHRIHIRHLAELAGFLEPMKPRAAAGFAPIPSAGPTPDAQSINELAESYFAAP
jgi:hypothetical protein